MEREELVRLLSCPINWSEICPETELVYWLNFVWFSACHRCQIEREVSLLFHYEDCALHPEEIEDLDDYEITSALHKVQGWHAAALEEFLSFSQRFAHLSAVGARTYSKHYSVQAGSATAIAKKSLSRGASVLHPCITPILQERLKWAAVNELVWQWMIKFEPFEVFSNPNEVLERLRLLIERHSLIIAVDFCRPIGASGGKSTNFGCFDIDFSTPQYHIFPISESEHNNAEIRSRLQGWNHGLQG